MVPRPGVHQQVRHRASQGGGSLWAAGHLDREHHPGPAEGRQEDAGERRPDAVP